MVIHNRHFQQLLLAFSLQFKWIYTYFKNYRVSDTMHICCSLIKSLLLVNIFLYENNLICTFDHLFFNFLSNNVLYILSLTLFSPSMCVRQCICVPHYIGSLMLLSWHNMAVYLFRSMLSLFSLFKKDIIFIFSLYHSTWCNSIT